jgi:UDP-2,3-diacylglucosamine hydrolase
MAIHGIRTIDIVPEALGLIAGEGIFPLLVARGARAAGRSVVCAALIGSADENLKTECDSFAWVGVARLGQWIRVLRSAGCRQAIMVGRVAKHKMYGRWRYLQHIPDFRTLRLWLTELRHDKRDQAVLYAVIRELGDEGITLIDSTQYTQEHLATAGVMTNRQPSEPQWIDARFGWELCQTLSRLDIGQAIAVKDKNILAVEAMEGTNAMIERAGSLCRTGGWTLIKVSNIKQDMRVDVPSIGVTTIEKIKAAGGTCLVVEAGKTILLEKPKVLELADQYKIAIVGCERTPGV